MLEDFPKLRVAEMCDDACARGGGTARKAEGLDCTLQIDLLSRGTKRHAFTESRVVNLDDLAPSSLKGINLRSERQPKLQRLLFLGDVLARERPVENSDGPREHALDVLLAGPVLRNLCVGVCVGVLSVCV